MTLEQFLLKDQIFSFKINKDLSVTGLSYNLSNSVFKERFLNKNILDVLNDFLDENNTECKEYIESLEGLINESFNLKKSSLDRYNICSESLDDGHLYTFILGLDLYSIDNEEYLILKFVDFEKKPITEGKYNNILNGLNDNFEILSKQEKIGRFLIDIKVAKNLVYADEVIPKLLHINHSIDNTYIVAKGTDKPMNNNYIIRDNNFFIAAEMLINGEITELNDEWLIKDSWIKLESKVIEFDENHKPTLIGGVMYDVTEYRVYKDIENLQAIYELAITSGGIGIFHYDSDKHDSEVFEANDIYANMFGLTENSDGYYLTSDFQETLEDLEEGISTNEDVKSSLKKFLHGDIEGTTDDILKVRNLKTGEFKYLLSSSKIASRYEDGSPRRFGGIVLDITERINNEKNQLLYAYRDELTLLPNNRKLIKDLAKKTSGMGLFFDLDDFKKVNDVHGHLVGDKVLKVVSDALRETEKKYQDAVSYRLYGDEFFVYLNTSDEKEAKKFEKELKSNIINYRKDLDKSIKIEASMGYSLFEEGNEIDDFIKQADYSMYKTKIIKKSKNKDKDKSYR
ncbi:sensor domain-containing diguanylate cyclase [Candidatus Izimaplasma bacterium ZiA1]|uniref:sensor domain-containing diguanylate cyclase n=1 Tax=Candidatus Izimoplasma sp. ZiA1 TaxID=2024899 RepID=UPI00143A1991